MKKIFILMMALALTGCDLKPDCSDPYSRYSSYLGCPAPYSFQDNEGNMYIFSPDKNGNYQLTYIPQSSIVDVRFITAVPVSQVSTNATAPNLPKSVKKLHE